jgi:hypothetical protein
MTATSTARPAEKTAALAATLAVARIREFLGRVPASAPAPAGRDGDEFRDVAYEFGVFLQRLAPVAARLGPALGEFSPLFPLLTSFSVRVVGVLSPFAPLAHVAMPALAECASVCTRQFVDLLPEVGPLLPPLGQELGGFLVAIGPLLTPAGDVFIAATQLLVVVVGLIGGYVPALAQAGRASTGRASTGPASMCTGPGPGAGAVTGDLPRSLAGAGLASMLRALLPTGSADRVVAGARTSCWQACVRAAGSASQQLPALAPPVHSGFTRILIALLPFAPGAVARAAAAVTRLMPVLEPMVRGGAGVAVAVVGALTSWLEPRALRECVPLRRDPAGTPRRDERTAPMISIVVYMNGRP